MSSADHACKESAKRAETTPAADFQWRLFLTPIVPKRGGEDSRGVLLCRQPLLVTPQLHIFPSRSAQRREPAPAPPQLRPCVAPSHMLLPAIRSPRSRRALQAATCLKPLLALSRVGGVAPHMPNRPLNRPPADAPSASAPVRAPQSAHRSAMHRLPPPHRSPVAAICHGSHSRLLALQPPPARPNPLRPCAWLRRHCGLRRGGCS